MIIGITGTDGAGKGTVVEYLVKKGYKHYHARKLLIEEIKSKDLPIDRNQMRLMANSLRKKHGNEFIAKLFFEQAKETGDTKIIIDSIRALEEALYLQQQEGVLLAVDANQNLRYERIQQRRSETDQVTFEQFQEHEDLEMNDPDPHGMQKQKVIDFADYTVTNEGTLEDLYSQIDAVLEQIGGAK